MPAPSIIKGIFGSNIIPCGSRGRVDANGLRRIITWLRGKGGTGFHPNGSMGEFIRQSFKERKTVVRIICGSAAGLPILPL